LSSVAGPKEKEAVTCIDLAVKYLFPLVAAAQTDDVDEDIYSDRLDTLNPP